MKYLWVAKVVTWLALMASLLIALQMVSGLARERMGYREQAAASIQQSLAGAQTLTAAIVTRQCTRTLERLLPKEVGGRVARIDEDFTLSALPQATHWSVNSQVEPRYRGLYTVNAYQLQAQATVDWDTLAELAVPKLGGEVIAVRCQAPQVEVGVSDPRGIRTVALSRGDAALAVQPGVSSDALKSGFHAPLDTDAAGLSQALQLRLNLVVVGLESLSFVPLANDNRVRLQSDWVHPSFVGAFLPEKRPISGAGFDATWAVSSLAAQTRSQITRKGEVCALASTAAAANCLQSFGVSFIDPVNPASLSDRAIKYGMLFIVLTFAGIALMEILRRVRVHPIQYLLMGAAMASFFLLLLSLSEHLPFGLAYALGALACVLLLTVYGKAVLGGWREAAPLSAGLGILYSVLYLVLQSEQHALLAGALLVFGVLAGFMLLTRHVQWHRWIQQDQDQDQA